MKHLITILLIILGGNVLAQVTNSRYQPPGDPNLNPSWDWTLNQPVTMYYSSNGSNPIKISNRYVPFWTNGNPLAAEKDMYRQDGWTLVWKDFGTSGDAPALPFFALYNKYRGTLRVMIYNATNEYHTLYRGELSFRNSSPTNPIFTHTANGDSGFSNSYDAMQTEIYMGTGAKYNDWIFLDFVVYGFKSNMNHNMILHLDVFGVNESEIQLEGDISLEEQIEVSQLGGSKMNGENIVEAYKKGQKFYKGANNLRNDLKKLSEDPAKSDKWWAKIVKGVVQNQIVSASPVIAGAIGFISSFIGGKDKAAPREPIKFDGELDLTGSIINTKLISRMDLKMSPGSHTPDRYSAVQTIDWGVFNLVSKPEVRVKRYQRYKYANIWMSGNLSYEFNNDLGMSIVKKEAAYIFSSDNGTAYLPFDTFQSKTFSVGYAMVPKGISVRVTYKINNPVKNSDDEIVMVKNYPINATVDIIRRRLASDVEFANEDEENLTDYLSIFPNPARDHITFDIPMKESGNAILTIYNTQGQIFISSQKHMEIGNNRWELDVDSQDIRLDRGAYIVKIQTPTDSYRDKLLIH